MVCTVKKVLITLGIVAGIALGIFLGHKLYLYAINTYNMAIADATQKIKQGVTEGVEEGIGGGIGKALNPVGFVGKLFGK